MAGCCAPRVRPGASLVFLGAARGRDLVLSGFPELWRGRLVHPGFRISWLRVSLYAPRSFFPFANANRPYARPSGLVIGEARTSRALLRVCFKGVAPGEKNSRLGPPTPRRAVSLNSYSTYMARRVIRINSILDHPGSQQVDWGGRSRAARCFLPPCCSRRGAGPSSPPCSQRHPWRVFARHPWLAQSRHCALVCLAPQLFHVEHHSR